MRTFDELIEEQQLTFVVAPKPDGSYEIDIDGKAVDVSWVWHGKNAEALKEVDSSCIWTVLDRDGELYIASGVNRSILHLYKRS
ncbi:hypothetical protein ACH42_00755 [Endozoicomonas sp. (ex Bugula neritina AB1)]|nr:hypothetical protein ACH42_00755 [Endozoicomonas sp. (ex Bugula neritina AB1)]